MKITTYSELPADYFETLNAVTDEPEGAMITRAGHDPLLMMALGNFESLGEAYLLKIPENASRLLTDRPSRAGRRGAHDPAE